jgi:hypothetical protein
MLRSLSSLAALALALSLPATAVAGKDPCAGVEIKKDAFGSSVWKLSLNLGTFSLFELKSTPQGTVFTTIAAEYNVSTKEALEGAVAQIALDDGTVFSYTLPGNVPPVLMSNGSGTVWQITMPVDAARLGQLAASRIKNVRIDVGNGATIGGAPVFMAPWGKKLQAAAACWSTTTATP